MVEHQSGGWVAEMLRSESFEVEVLAALMVRDEHPSVQAPQVVIHEVSTPGRGFDVNLTGVPPRTPVMVIIDCHDEGVVLDAYARGAASVLGPATGPREIVARVRALARRMEEPDTSAGDVVVVGSVALDRTCRRLTVGGRPVHVPRREFEIAEVLMRRAGLVVTRQALLVELWGGHRRDTKTLDVQVGRLRSRLAAAEGRTRIVTVRGLGYRFLTDADLHVEGLGVPAVPAPELHQQRLARD
ncbi:MAG: DNA-binding response regulator, partial [Actinobacteria bacterium]|nr:DNA-binding response regulator [Actinomycetota bacterium]